MTVIQFNLFIVLCLFIVKQSIFLLLFEIAPITYATRPGEKGLLYIKLHLCYGGAYSHIHILIFFFELKNKKKVG